MVAARAQFLGAGHYAPLAAAIADAAQAYTAGEGLIFESGAGTGYYLAHCLHRLPDRCGLAVDLSKYAARRAAKSHDRMGSVVADIWNRIPLRDASVGLALDIFAPRNAAELYRILRRDSALLVVTPQPSHLAELREPLGLLSIDSEKDARLARVLGPYFECCLHRNVEWRMNLEREDILSLVTMGPSARHIDADGLRERISRPAVPMAVGAAVTMRVYRRN